MESYKDTNNDSGVKGYEIGDTYIIVWFKGSVRSYTYSYNRAGAAHVEKMKELARKGDGLNAYIMNFVKDKFDR